jgi:activator of Hsp90 ATPase-like protein
VTDMNRNPDPRLDLLLERVVDVPPELVWAAWTTPEHVKKWFTPAPWTTVDCEIDLRPGGIFRFVMRSPEGQEFPNVGCYLEIVKKPEARLDGCSRPWLSPGERATRHALLYGDHRARAAGKRDKIYRSRDA